MTIFPASAASYEVLRRLEEAGHEAVFVGGAVRDFILGKVPTDIDIATSAEPREVKKVFSNTIDVGIAHGTVLVIAHGEPIEVTTFRTESTYTDHRRPDDVAFVKSFKEDLLRRDFTMNALAMTREGNLIDLFGGKQDLQNCLIRAVGDPVDRFNEDALRMLRAIRFSSVLDFKIEERTLQAIGEKAAQIRFISIERIKIEMDKLFLGKNPVRAFNYLANSNLCDALPLFPKVFDNLNRVIPFDTSLEGWTYLAISGNFSAADISRAYKLSNDERKFIAAVLQLFKKRIVRLYTLDDYYAADLIVLKSTEKLFEAFYSDKPTLTKEQLREKKRNLPIQSIKDLAVNGNNLIQWAGCRGGNWTGAWIEKIEHSVLHGLIANDLNTIKDWFINDFKREK